MSTQDAVDVLEQLYRLAATQQLAIVAELRDDAESDAAAEYDRREQQLADDASEARAAAREVA